MKKIFVALGNNRPRILVELEDCVLHAIIAISKGTSTHIVIDELHTQIQSRQKDLTEDDEALKWFQLAGKDIDTPLTSPTSEIPTTPLQGV
jgi:hypothetical protein